MSLPIRWRIPSSHVKVYDANLADTRERFGVIDGAHLPQLIRPITMSLRSYPPTKTPRLVFYCFDKRCMASHEAARRAIDAGYKNVSVMGDGIVGWRIMGAPIHQVTEAEAAKQGIGLVRARSAAADFHTIIW